MSWCLRSFVTLRMTKDDWATMTHQLSPTQLGLRSRGRAWTGILGLLCQLVHPFVLADVPSGLVRRQVWFWGPSLDAAPPANL